MDNSLLIKSFNERFPVGSKVQWRSIGKPDVPFETLTVQTPAYDSNGQAVVFFQERRGYCSIDPMFVNYDGEAAT